VGEDAEAAAVAGGLVVDGAELGLAEGGWCGGDVWAAGFGRCGGVD